MPTGKPRYTITLDEEMLKKIDDFRFENRFPNRTQATLELIRIGMETLEKKKQEREKKELSYNNDFLENETIQALRKNLPETSEEFEKEFPPIEPAKRNKKISG